MCVCVYVCMYRDSTTMAESNGKLYCRACHGKNFGPKGFGYGGGAGTLANTGH